MIRRGFPLESLRDDDELASTLVSATSESRLSDIHIGIAAHGRQLFAATDEAQHPRTSTQARNQSVRAGCLAKPVTAALLARAVAEKEIGWTSSVNDVLGLNGANGRALSGVTIRQLLNHTHGLDASAVEEMPRTRDGRIDAPALCDQLAPTCISAPGQLYSYSNAGPWLAGAVLEKLYSKDYCRLLSDKLFPACSLDSEIPEGSLICPATGGELSLSTRSWLLFLESHINSRNAGARAEHEEYLHTLLTDQSPLPGWSPAERASCLGWNSYGGGWFGHNSYSANQSSVLRFNPDQRVAIVVSAPANTALVASAIVFGRLLPEFADPKLPRQLSPQDCELLDLSQYLGIYRQARTSIVITRASPTTLSFALDDPHLGEDLSMYPLRSAADHLFIQHLRPTPQFSFVQFVRSNAASRFDYVWNGKQLWRRI